MLNKRNCLTVLKLLTPVLLSLLTLLCSGTAARASEAELAIPPLDKASFNILGYEIDGWHLLLYGALVITGTLGISLYQLYQIHKQPAHKSMLNVAETIFQTCKTYLIQQGKFLFYLFLIIASAMLY